MSKPAVTAPKKLSEEKPEEEPKKETAAAEEPKPEGEKCEDGKCPTCGQDKPSEEPKVEGAEAPADNPEKKDDKEGMSRLNELSALFPDRPQFVLDQLKKGNTVAQAQSEFKDLRIAELTKQLAGGGAGAEPAPFSAPKDTTGDFIALAKEKAKAEKISEGKAIELLAKQQPELHKKYVESLRAK